MSEEGYKQLIEELKYLESPVPQKKFSQFLLKNAGKYGLTFSKHIEGKFAFVKRSETLFS